MLILVLVFVFIVLYNISIFIIVDRVYDIYIFLMYLLCWIFLIKGEGFKWNVFFFFKMRNFFGIYFVIYIECDSNYGNR